MTANEILTKRLQGITWAELSARTRIPVSTLRTRARKGTPPTNPTATNPAAADPGDEEDGEDYGHPPVLAPDAFTRPAGGPALATKYRPLYLSEVLGQPTVTAALAAFIKNPVSSAMIFHGESGTGKTSAAQTIARELGCCMEDEETGGYFEIASGEMTADQVRDKVNLLRYRPLTGSGWRVLIANEADRMQRPAETIWLDVLENLPPKTVIIFTTNEPGRLSQRFIGRCETYAFESNKATIRPWIQALALRIWNREVGTGAPPNLSKIGMPTLGAIDTMHASFRLALQQLQPLIRAAKVQP